MGMNKLEFVRKLDALPHTRVSDKTGELWFHILAWVEQHTYADVADSPDFIAHVQNFRPVTVSTIGNHLRRMAQAGFLKEHAVRRRLSPEAKDTIGALSLFPMGFDASMLATAFKRYTLPDVPCPLEMRAYARHLDSAHQRIHEALQRVRPPAAA